MYLVPITRHNKFGAFLISKNMLSKFVIRLMGYFILVATSHAQTAQITGNIPYAKSLIKSDGSLAVWTMSEIRKDKIKTVRPLGETASVMERDSNSLGYKLGDTSETPDETKDYEGTLDLTNAILPVTVAILVDDIATLTIKEMPTGNEPVSHITFTDTYKVEGTALWNPKSYKEFSTPLPPGRKYQLNLVYKNTANLTANYTDGKVDIDGVSVYVSLLPVEIVDKNKIWISKLKIGKMVEGGVLTGSAAKASLNIDGDSDQFFLRFKGGAALAGISVKVSTTDNPDPTYNNKATQIDLVASGADAISKSLLLVSDDVDDSYEVDAIKDDAMNDRTYKIQLGGNFTIESIKVGTGSWQSVNVKTPAPYEEKVKVQFINCKAGLPYNKTFLWGTDTIEKAKKFTKERFGQAGVEVEFLTTADGPDIGLDGWLEPDEFPSKVVSGVLDVPQETPLPQNLWVEIGI